jgi:hypothetical protein
MSSTIAELTVSKPLSSVAATTIAGQRVLGVRGKLAPSSVLTAAATLYARAAGKPLPVEEVASQPNVGLTVTLGNWNEPIHLATPKAAVSISTTGLE